MVPIKADISLVFLYPLNARAAWVDVASAFFAISPGAGQPDF